MKIMNSEISLVEKVGYVQYGIDHIPISEITMPPKVILEMNNWKDVERIVFETIMLLTNSGQNGILITGPQLSKISKVSTPSVFNALRFLLQEGWILKEKYAAAGSPNIIFIDTNNIDKFSGDYTI